MKAVVFEDVGKISLQDVPDPSIEQATDAVVRITTSAICGTDLHMVRGTVPGMKPGTVLGHEGVGIVEAVGKQVRNLRTGDRVIIPSTICCGVCSYCRAGFTAQCDNANPHGHRAGTAFYGGPETTGPFGGLQAQYARVPYANVGLVRVPDDVTDEQAIMLSDIFPTGYFAAELAHPHAGSTVAVFGCGPVGQFTIASLKLMDVGRIFAVDQVQSRLEMARAQGAEVINFADEDPVEVILELTSQIGVDRAIDAVGVDADPRPSQQGNGNAAELSEIAPRTNPQNGKWRPGQAPTQALRWAVDCLAKAGTLSIVGVYPETDRFFPIGMTMNKNLTVRLGNCNHRRYIPRLLGLVRTGAIEPARILSQEKPLHDAIHAFEQFDQRQAGWVKVALQP